MIKKVLAFSNIVFLICIIITMPVNAQSKGYVGNNKVNVRDSPNLNPSSVLFLVDQGEPVDILGESGDFYLVNVSGQENLYIYKEYVYTEVSIEGIANDSSVAVYSIPRKTENDVPIGYFDRNDALSITSEGIYWYGVLYNGGIGYIEKGNVDIVDNPIPSTVVVQPTPTPAPTPVPQVEEELIPSGEWIITQDASCTEEGLQVQYYLNSDEIALSEPIPKLPHTPNGEWVVTKDASCSEVGTRVQYCTICGDIALSETIPELPHTPSGEWVVLSEPLCNEPGHRVQYCLICGDIAIEEVIPALTGLDHVFERHHISGNTFIPPIVYEDACTVCGFVEEHSDWKFAWVSPAILLGFVSICVSIVKTRKSMRKKKTFVCPYCFETHLVQDVQFRCANRDCPDVDDVELTKYEGGSLSAPLKLKRTFPAPKTKNYSAAKYAKCPDCGRETSKVICPSCHNSLPESTMIGKDMIISVVGSRDVGKSHFIGVIINELIERVAGRFDGSLTGFDDTMARYEENFGRHLYVELTKLSNTQSSMVNKNNGAYKPMIFTLSIKMNGVFAKIKNYTLVFFDTAGEDLNEFDTMNTVNRYICKSAGIIFLLDPMQIWSVRNQLDDATVSSASSVAVQQATRPDDIMTRVSRLIRSDRKMDSAKKINTPVAAVFSKFDAIVPIVPQGCTVLEPSPHCNEGVFVMTDWHNVNSEIQSLLKTWGATAFTQQLEINYTNFSYFAVSSLGLENSPRSDSHIDRPRPHRIEDALLWILKENGVIKSKQPK